MAGYTGDEEVARAALRHEVPAVRAAGLGALARLGKLNLLELRAGLVDPAALVRRRACVLAGRPGLAGQPGLAGMEGFGEGAVVDALACALSDPDPTVVEAACWALGELGAVDSREREESDGDLAGGARDTHAGEVLFGRASQVVGPLATLATSHPEPLCREAAVAALGALGHPDGLGAVLAAMADKPAVRRRAAVALAAFEAPEAERALEKAAQDRDWQVRQVAEDVLGWGLEHP